MLWKLADNVKYEDDCEVSLDRDAGRGKKAPSSKSLATAANTGWSPPPMLWSWMKNEKRNALELKASGTAATWTKFRKNRITLQISSNNTKRNILIITTAFYLLM